MKKQVHLFYSGHVQGIGFRYAVGDIARDLKICGWVKNLDDLRVEVSAEAEEAPLKDFIQQINLHFSRNIKKVDIEWLPAGGQFRDFSVKF